MPRDSAGDQTAAKVQRLTEVLLANRRNLVRLADNYQLPRFVTTEMGIPVDLHYKGNRVELATAIACAQAGVDMPFEPITDPRKK